MKKAATTRYPSPIVSSVLSDEEKIEAISAHFEGIMTTLGLDLTDASLVQTPRRVAEMYVKEVFSGLDSKNFPDVGLFEEDHVSEAGHHSLVVTKCGFTSFCEHHFVPMMGVAFVAYIPRGKLLGLSKIHRIVRYFAKRPQLQERLTSQIADSLSHILASSDVAVSIQAQHLCVIARGVHDEESQTTTSYFGGAFTHDAAKREEFFQAIQRLQK